MSADRDFVLDANAFIQPQRRFYPFDVCPGYWQALKWHNKERRICSVDRVRDELEAGGDDLWDWAKRLPKGFFEATDDLEVVEWYRQLARWVRAEPQFMPRAETDFASGADGWLVAFAKARSRVVVTLEEFDPVVVNAYRSRIFARRLTWNTSTSPRCCVSSASSLPGGPQERHSSAASGFAAGLGR